MTDLESRLREALNTEPGALSPDALLDDVRRGVRRRRARRTTGVVVAAAVVAAAIGGTALQRHHAPAPSKPAPHSGPLMTGTLALSVTAAGEAFTVSANQGCTTPCSTIWKQGNSGPRTRVATILAKPGHSPFGPVFGIEMAPDGRNGWAWGDHLLATHDGGRTWTTVTSGPGAHPPFGELDLLAGPQTTWAITRTVDGATLWRTPVGQDAWTQETLPAGLDFGVINLVESLPHSQVAILNGKTCGYAVGDGTTWQNVTAPRYRLGPQFGGKVSRSTRCGPGGGGRFDVSNGGMNGFMVANVTVGTTPSTSSDPLGRAEEVWVHRNRAILVTPTGVSPVSLHLGADFRVLAVSHSGDHAWILTGGRRLFSSDDGGRHWTVRRP